MILEKFRENLFSESCWKILDEFCEYFVLAINKLFMNQMIVPYREILGAQFLRMDLASSSHTAKLWA